ncbi:MAG: ribose 5-phosphate isomerase B [Deltaproteobacteria bacterium]|jgi:ribose 5-phosphate isomerase B|nr:ribose 5-phosphate isomerase B [Deltaproteobacteria bacterium]MCL5880478.1 ribose 5-phosphate isomerase B [Deltaproteobacteria bacterium]MDA8304659.1 ribose 5-phosphate isomerase B [Deltaproteobacteria bacterium]
MIFLGSDHAGFELKESIKNYLKEKGINYLDMGTDSLKSVDYPDYALKVAEKVKAGDDKNSFGILVCGTGIGMDIAANKIDGIRAALIHDEYTAEVAKKHNNANIVTLGGRTTTPTEAVRYIDKFMSSKYEGGRHEDRISKITSMEKLKD